MTSRGFASDNNAGIHPEILAAMQAANTGHALAYGDDPYTQKAVEQFRAHFGEHVEVFLMFNGTGANTLGLKSITASYQAILCAETAHIYVDECGAPEKFTGCKLITIPTPNGKLTPDLVKPYLAGFGDQHHVQPKVISITQATEMGTVYRPEEIQAIADLAHHHGMWLHMDGARLCNAAAFLNLPLRALTSDVGVDLLSFGGTKNGMMLGEAVVFFHPEQAQTFRYVRKQGMQLASKMRFIAAQFLALLSNDLWLKNAQQANAMAQLLAEKLARIPEIELTQPVEANGVFARFPKAMIQPLQAQSFFYVWNQAQSEIRLMTSFDTTPDDIEAFIAHIEHVLPLSMSR